jgi:hypothetical protein
MAVADPLPISWQPDVAGNGRRSCDLLARGRRGDEDDAVDEMALIRDDHAAADEGREQ